MRVVKIVEISPRFGFADFSPVGLTAQGQPKRGHYSKYKGLSSNTVKSRNPPTCGSNRSGTPRRRPRTQGDIVWAPFARNCLWLREKLNTSLTIPEKRREKALQRKILGLLMTESREGELRHTGFEGF